MSAQLCGARRYNEASTTTQSSASYTLTYALLDRIRDRRARRAQVTKSPDGTVLVKFECLAIDLPMPAPCHHHKRDEAAPPAVMEVKTLAAMCDGPLQPRAKCKI